MKTEYAENVIEYWKLPNGSYFVKMEENDGLDDDCDIKNNSTCSFLELLS